MKATLKPVLLIVGALSPGRSRLEHRCSRLGVDRHCGRQGWRTPSSSLAKRAAPSSSPAKKAAPSSSLAKMVAPSSSLPRTTAASKRS